MAIYVYEILGNKFEDYDDIPRCEKFYKIGVSNDPTKRDISSVTLKPDGIDFSTARLIFSVDFGHGPKFDYRIEKILHAMMGVYRVGKSEFFSAPRDAIINICKKAAEISESICNGKEDDFLLPGMAELLEEKFYEGPEIEDIICCPCQNGSIKAPGVVLALEESLPQARVYARMFMTCYVPGTHWYFNKYEDMLGRNYYWMNGVPDNHSSGNVYGIPEGEWSGQGIEVHEIDLFYYVTSGFQDAWSTMQKYRSETKENITAFRAVFLSAVCPSARIYKTGRFKDGATMYSLPPKEVMREEYFNFMERNPDQCVYGLSGTVLPRRFVEIVDQENRGIRVQYAIRKGD